MPKNPIIVGSAKKLPRRKAAHSPSPFAPVPTNGPYGTRDNREKLMLFLRGFKDGAGMVAQRHPTEPAYVKGYEDGSEARAGACADFCEAIGHDPSDGILR